MPYLPSGVPWPRAGDGSGERLHLLAQFNLAELPAPAGFPERGWLQFFILAGETYGMDLANLASGAGHAVLYHPPAAGAPGQAEEEGPGLDDHIESLGLPFLEDRPVALTGEPVKAPLSYSDFRFAARARELAAADPATWSWLDGPMPADRPGEALTGRFDRAFGRGGHLLGGSPAFIWEDPRVMPAYSGFTTLLAQIDSDPAAHLSWGDLGICHFFIEPGRLQARDFSRVLYHWDSR
jgi:uncharacterized protein YwqG